MADDKCEDKSKLITVANRLLPGAPTKTRRLVAVESKIEKQVCQPKFTEANEFEDDLAFRRRVVFEKFERGLLNRTEAMSELKVKRSRFYTLYGNHKECMDYTGMIRGKRGPKEGSVHASADLLVILEKAFKEKYQGPKATIAAVLRRAEELCHSQGEKRPTKYVISKFVNSKSERILYTCKYGEEAAAQKFDARPGSKEADPEDADVQMDHTLVDMLLVDERDRTLILGRPWLTVIICTLTRVILGYFLSFRAPSVITVQLAILSAVLSKDSVFNPISADPAVYPFCGVPPGIYTDNATEFTTQKLIRKCKRYCMDWDHRPIGKKWYGGIVERDIGTFMTCAVHFLPGATGSNSVERVHFQSELNATMTLSEFREWFANEVTKYHSRRHDAVGCSPRMAWAELRCKGAVGELPEINHEEALAFALDFMPSEYDLKIHTYGINFASRRYWGDELESEIGHKCEIRYDPNNLSSIWVLLGSNFVNISCSRMREGDSLNYESHYKSISVRRLDPEHRQIPVGSYTDEYGLEAEVRSEEIIAQAIANTAEAKIPVCVEKTQLPRISVDERTDSKLSRVDVGLSNGNEIDELDDLKPQILIDKDDY